MSIYPDIVPFPVLGPTREAVVMGIKGDFLARTLAQTERYYEIDLLTAIHRYRRGGVYVDVGAHYGNHTAYFLLEGGAEHVVAFEPHPKNFAVLSGTVAANGLESRTTLHNAAVHDTWTSARLEGNAGNSGNFMVVAEGGDCPLVRLDDTIADIGPISVIKIDVEGSEENVLRSGMDILDRDHPILTVECRTGGRFKGLKEQAERLLAPLGYKNKGCYGATPTYLFCAT